MSRLFDRVYGELIHLPPLLARLAASPLFHRLDGIRQLGGCAVLYPSATHTRREHSFGVCHLAGLLGRKLRAQRPDLLRERDVLCLQVAGLLHDLGHGPFSHLFEEHVRERCPHQHQHWSHEDMTLSLLALLLEDVPLSDLSQEDRRLVSLLILGLEEEEPWPFSLLGREEAHTRFLLDVVHNRRSGLDVDKLDYLARDALAVFGATHACDVMRILDAARLEEDEESTGRVRLVFRDSVHVSVDHIFSLRARLHRQIYQHPRALLVERGLKALMTRALDEDTLRAALACPKQFATLTDATVWARASPDEISGLLRRAKRLPVSVHVRTQPSCPYCGQETRVRDAFCTGCGESTEGRLGVRWDAATTALVPPGLLLDAEEVTQTVRGGMEETTTSSSLVVVLANVHCGMATTEVDPHGVAWRGYDGLVPHSIVATCFLQDEEEDATRAEECFVQWGKTAGTVVY